MEQKSRIRKTIRIAIGTMVLLLGVLMIHIAMVVEPERKENNTQQLSRIDFLQAPSEQHRVEMMHLLQTQPGVKDSYFSASGNMLIIRFDATQNKSTDLLMALQQHFDVTASLHTVSATEATKGCPVAGATSAINSISAVFAGIF